jgi:glutamate dehydrogenase/leucine dehydrogenase
VHRIYTLDFDVLIPAAIENQLTEANAGGVTASYFEWVQNTTNGYWTEERVREKLATQLREAFADLREIKTASATTRTWRGAAYTRAVESVLQAEEYRSNVARDAAELPD